MAGEQFSLVWNSFPTNLSSGLYSLLSDEHLVDVTLAAEGKILGAHKLILSVCSTYFRDLFKANYCKHPIVVLKDVNYRDLSAMLQFMYKGEVSIKQEDIASFLQVAETLQIKGLTKDKNENKGKSNDDDDDDDDDDDEIERLEEKLKIEKDDDSLEQPQEMQDENFQEFTQLFNDESGASQINLPSTNSDDTLSSSRITFHNVDSNQLKTVSATDVQSIQAMFNDNYMSVDKITSNDDHADDVEPLNFTSDVNEMPKDKPLDYRYGGMDSSNSGITTSGNLETRNQIISTEGISYQSDYGEKPPPDSHNDGNNSKASRYNSSSSSQTKSSKGRRTVKGIPHHSTLPLETTLRVVSELGPTLRVERGKIVRMYSCPWCLRHFTRKENLKLHVRYIHGPLESLTCKLCGNKYKNSNSLRVHSYLYHNTKRSNHKNKSLVVPSNI